MHFTLHRYTVVDWRRQMTLLCSLTVLRFLCVSSSCICVHVVLLSHGEMSLVRLRAIWITNHPPSLLWHCWLGHLTCKNIVSEMTWTVSSGTLNLAQPTNQLFSGCFFWRIVLHYRYCCFAACGSDDSMFSASALSFFKFLGEHDNSWTAAFSLMKFCMNMCLETCRSLLNI